MIKKFLSLFLLSICFLSLFCGCNGYRETGNSYIVTMLGFDFDKKYTAFAEVVTSNNKSDEDMPIAEIYKSTGNSPESALYSLKSKLPKSLMFNHCSAVVMGSGIKGKEQRDVFEFCEELHELNLSVYMVCADVAENIFTSCEPVSLARGYDIAGLITEMKEASGVDVLNRFYECNKYLKEKEYFTLPIVKTNDSKIEVSGNNVYKDGDFCEKLTVDEVLIYSVLSGKNRGGVLLLDKARAKVNISEIEKTKDKKELVLSLKISNEKENFIKTFKDKANELVKTKGELIGLPYEKVTVKRMKAK